MLSSREGKHCRLRAPRRWVLALTALTCAAWLGVRLGPHARHRGADEGTIGAPSKERTTASATSRRAHETRSSKASKGRPNILLIVADDHAAGTLGVEGDPRAVTPSLDALAKSGVRFTRAFCNSPLCTPSRQSFITGRLPHAVGVTKLQTPLPASAVTLGDRLGRAGYRTAAIGKMHFNGPSHHGFELRLDTAEWESYLGENPPPGGDLRRPWRPFREHPRLWLNADCRDCGLPASHMESTYYVDRALEFARRDDDRPFLLVVGMYEPHAPFRFPREWNGRLRSDQFEVPPLEGSDRDAQPKVFRKLSETDFLNIQRAYFTSLSFLDEQVGRLVRGLDASGVGANTVVVYLGDNGYMLGKHGRFEKHCMYDAATRVPLLIRAPGASGSGRALDDLVELVDLVPTLLDLAGVETPSDLHGRSLAPLLRGEPGAHGRDVVVSEYLEDEVAMARDARWKLIVGTGKKHEHYYDAERERVEPYVRLFDLESDPRETTDLGDRPDLEPVRARLLAALRDRFLSTRGRLPAVPANLDALAAVRFCLAPPD